MGRKRRRKRRRERRKDRMRNMRRKDTEGSGVITQLAPFSQIHFFKKSGYQPTDRPTDRPTDGRTKTLIEMCGCI